MPASLRPHALPNETDHIRFPYLPAQGVCLETALSVSFESPCAPERALFALRPHHSRDVTPRSTSAGCYAASVTFLQSPALTAHRQPERTIGASRGTFVENGDESERGIYLTRVRGFASESKPNADGNSEEDAESASLAGLGKACACLRLWKQGCSDMKKRKTKHRWSAKLVAGKTGTMIYTRPPKRRRDWSWQPPNK